MTWFLPTFSRPECFERLKNAPGGFADDVCVIFNEDDPRLEENQNALASSGLPWRYRACPAGSRLCDAYRFVYREFPDLEWYGMLADDYNALTPGWDQRMVEAAGSRYLSYANGHYNEFPLMRTQCVLGGDLVKELGWLVPPYFVHNYFDCMLDDALRPLGLLKPVEDAFVDHLHWKFCPEIKQDATYLRGSSDQSEDAGRYYTWVGSYERHVLHRKLKAWMATWANAS